MRGLLDEEQKRTTEILAVSVDPKEDLQKMADRISKEDGIRPGFVLLSDPGHRVIDRYGLLNPADKRGIPHPTTFVIDRDGVVRWKFTEVNYKVRPSNAGILKALAGLP
ncbi:MAG: peroxiredoxin family protein [Gemmatimonadetes bacterium]|nr:peroxiredoxin family protein [Gemmatimonadota bacterium]